MEWMKYTPYVEPPQGLKVACWRDGIPYFAMRIVYKLKSYWMPIPFTDSQFASLDPPEYWAFAEFPPGFHGYTTLGLEDENPMPFEEFMQKHPEEWEEISENLFKKMIENTGKPFYEMDSTERKTSRTSKKPSRSKKV